MNTIQIIVGTKNKIKLQAVEVAANKVFHQPMSIESVEVDSDISSNPLQHEEAIKGARQRASSSLIGSTADLGIGIEGTLFKQSNKWFMTTWVVVIHSDTKKEYIAQGIAVEISEKEIIEQIHPDKPLGDICKALPSHYTYDQFGTPMSYLTGGVFDRSRAIVIAMEAVFAQVKRDLV